MAPRPVANQRFRQRKLSTRHALQVIKGEKELETLDGDQQHTPKVETGVEKHEETVSFPSFFLVVAFLALQTSLHFCQPCG